MKALHSITLCAAILVAASALAPAALADDVDLMPPAGIPMFALEDAPPAPADTPPPPPPVRGEPTWPTQVASPPPPVNGEPIYPTPADAPPPTIVGDVEAVRTPYTTPSPCAALG